ncbi:MAG: hypothetical protein QM541_01500 [Flavobacterium sp.]|nr:hypothetical protein [Flavobacterium sp.]
MPNYCLKILSVIAVCFSVVIGGNCQSPIAVMAKDSNVSLLPKKIPITKQRSTKVQLLYDFLNQQNHVPQSPILFRVGWGM